MIKSSVECAGDAYKHNQHLRGTFQFLTKFFYGRLEENSEKH